MCTLTLLTGFLPSSPAAARSGLDRVHILRRRCATKLIAFSEGSSGVWAPPACYDRDARVASRLHWGPLPERRRSLVAEPGTEGALIAASRRGDEDAFRELVQ